MLDRYEEGDQDLKFISPDTPADFGPDTGDAEFKNEYSHAYDCVKLTSLPTLKI